MYTFAIRKGILFGTLFGLGGILFVAVSTLTGISRETWLVVNQVKGVLLFSICLICGVIIYNKVQRYRDAILGGGIAGFCGAIITMFSLYFFSFFLTDAVKQYPFEFHSVQNSGTANFREFMDSNKGRQTVFETSIGIMPIVCLLATFIGATLGAVGAFIAKLKLKKQ